MRKSDEDKFTTGGPEGRCLCLRLPNRRPEPARAGAGAHLQGWLGAAAEAIAERSKAEVVHMGCRHEQRELCLARSLWAHPFHSLHSLRQPHGLPKDHSQPKIAQDS